MRYIIHPPKAREKIPMEVKYPLILILELFIGASIPYCRNPNEFCAKSGCGSSQFF